MCCVSISHHHGRGYIHLDSGRAMVPMLAYSRILYVWFSASFVIIEDE